MITSRIANGIRAIRLFKNWYIGFLGYLGFGSNLKTLTLKDGTKFRVRKNARDFQTITDIYMTKPYHRYLSILKNGSCVIDIGANIGAFSILVAQKCLGVQVYSYEPQRDNYELMKENICLNNLN